MGNATRWDKYFLELCLVAAKMSKDPSTKVGAVVVGPDREVRSIGFNGFPRKVADTDARLNNREEKLDLIVHGEMNAILTAARIGVDIKGCSLYLVCIDNKEGVVWGSPPCIRCTVEAIQAGISEVVSLPITRAPERWKGSVEKARDILKESGVTYREVDIEL